MPRVILALACLALAGCTTPRSLAPADAGADAPLAPLTTNAIDLLFVIDNSNSPEAATEPFLLHFQDIVAPLLGHDLHIGIVTTDLGAGPMTPPSCDTVGGDQGKLQNNANGATCSTAHLNVASDRFLISRPDASGGVETNFVGDLADVFSCYAAVGTGGCGFEHPLASPVAALEACGSAGGCRQQVNEGFLREEALLAVVIATDEDDCSAPPTSTLFDPTQTAPTSVLGPLTSYRCFEFGILCDGVDVGRDAGPRTGCVPGNKSANPAHQLYPVASLAERLRATKSDPRLVYAAVIAGPPSPVSVGLDQQGYPDLQPSCVYQYGAADPGIRLEAFTREFMAGQARFVSVCDPDLPGAIGRIGTDIAAILGGAP